MLHPDDEPCRGVDFDKDDEPCEPDFRCGWCDDYGWLYIYDQRTDAIIGTRPCPRLNDPLWHPPATPVPLAAPVVMQLGHDPGCDGTCGYPDGCPPF